MVEYHLDQSPGHSHGVVLYTLLHWTGTLHLSILWSFSQMVYHLTDTQPGPLEKL